MDSSDFSTFFNLVIVFSNMTFVIMNGDTSFDFASSRTDAVFAAIEIQKFKLLLF